jgi:hypothetical protein
MAIWVAVGGRGTLVGAVLGAWFINGAKSWLTAAFPSAWLYVLGGLFVVVTLFLPKGLVGLFELVRRAVTRSNRVAPPAPGSAGKMMSPGKMGAGAIVAAAAAVAAARGTTANGASAAGSDPGVSAEPTAARDSGPPSVPHV